MLWGGIALLVFIVFHILHLTTGTIDPIWRAASAMLTGGMIGKLKGLIDSYGEDFVIVDVEKLRAIAEV